MHRRRQISLQQFNDIWKKKIITNIISFTIAGARGYQSKMFLIFFPRKNAAQMAEEECGNDCPFVRPSNSLGCERRWRSISENAPLQPLAHATARKKNSLTLRVHLLLFLFRQFVRSFNERVNSLFPVCNAKKEKKIEKDFHPFFFFFAATANERTIFRRTHWFAALPAQFFLRSYRREAIKMAFG